MVTLRQSFREWAQDKIILTNCTKMANAADALSKRRHAAAKFMARGKAFNDVARVVSFVSILIRRTKLVQGR